MEDASKFFPKLAPGLTSALLDAAYALDCADRRASSCVLLRAVAAQSSGLPALKALFRKAMEASLLELARDSLAIIESAMPAHARDGWVEKARLDLGNITPFTAELLRDRLRQGRKAARSDASGPICYMLHMSLPHNATGYAMRTQEFAKAMIAGGRELHCMTRPGFPADVGQESFPGQDTIDGITYHRIAEPSRLHCRQTSYMDRAADVLAEKFEELRPSIVMAASNHETAAPALLAARRLGIPFVYEMRGFWELTKISVNPGYEEDPQFRRSFKLEAQIADSADQVFTLTGGMAKELRRRGVSTPHIDLLPNAADPERFRPRKRDEEFAGRLGLGRQTTVIGYVGSFTAYEGLDDLIRACGALHRRGRDFHLLLVGDEARHLEGQIIPGLRGLVAQENLAGRTTMTGRVPASEVERWYSLVDISPIPRKSTPVTELVSPMKPFEAMAMEKTVLLPDLPSMLDIVRDGETGRLYRNGNWESLAEALDDVLINPEKRKAMGQAARRWIEGERNWRIIADSCAAALERLEAGDLPSNRGTGA